jgi:hypothetical protein
MPRQCGVSQKRIHSVKTAANRGAGKAAGQHSGGELGSGRLPIPGQELIELLDVVIVDAREHVRKPSLRVDVVEPRSLDQRVLTAARSPPRSEPANSHDLRPSAMPRSARSAALLVRQMRPSSRKRVKVSQRLSM